jgi:hypothetical protein
MGFYAVDNVKNDKYDMAFERAGIWEVSAKTI